MVDVCVWSSLEEAIPSVELSQQHRVETRGAGQLALLREEGAVKSPASGCARRVRIAPASRGPTQPCEAGVGEQAESAPGVGD